METPQLGTLVNIFSPICLSLPHLCWTNYSSILKRLLLFSYPLWIFCLKKTSNYVYLLLSATIRAKVSLIIMQLWISLILHLTLRFIWLPRQVIQLPKSEISNILSWFTIEHWQVVQRWCFDCWIRWEVQAHLLNSSDI